MTTMIEKVARHMAAKHYANRFGKPIDDPHVTKNVKGNWQIWRADAVSAIEAMREPTPRMISEMESAASFGIGRPNDDEAVPRVWQWGIDAALNEEVAG